MEPGQRNSCAFASVVVGVVIALGLQIAGFASPAWMIMRIGNVKIQFGLWTIQICVDDECRTVTHEEWDRQFMGQAGGISSGMREYQVETCLALAFLICGLGVFCSSRNQSCAQNQRGLYWGAFTAFLLSGILCLVAAGKFGDDQRKAHDFLKLVNLSPFLFPYSLILTGIGGIIAIITALVMLCALRMCTNQQSTPPPAYAAYEMPHAGQPNPGYAGQPQTVVYAGQPQTVVYAGQPYGGQPQPVVYAGGQPYAGQQYGGQPGVHHVDYGRKY